MQGVRFTIPDSPSLPYTDVTVCALNLLCQRNVPNHQPCTMRTNMSCSDQCWRETRSIIGGAQCLEKDSWKILLAILRDCRCHPQGALGPLLAACIGPMPLTPTWGLAPGWGTSDSGRDGKLVGGRNWVAGRQASSSLLLLHKHVLAPGRLPSPPTLC